MRKAFSVALLALLTATSAAAAADPAINVLSTRADLVSGGDALVEVVPPASFDASALTVSVDGKDATPAFAVRPGGRFIGLLTGLHDGDNTVVARAGAGGGRLVVTSHPSGGPVLSGPQIQPWTCMEGALDKQCTLKPKYEYVYKSSAGEFQEYDPENPPSDVAETTTDNGVTVPYIVRVETGSIDRDEYRIAVLFDPKKGWEPWAPQPQFNHKLLITHGASCDTGYTAAEAPDVLNDTALSRGFAVMSNALDNSGHNCNVVVQGEALQMTKERVIEQLGELRYTIGSGCSGGALAQQQTANAFPGLYQGITPACSFPDTWTGRMHYEDYSLLRRYFENPSSWSPGVGWTPADMSAVLGHPNYANSIVYNTAIAALLDPSRSCPGLEAEKVYDPETNPKGVRCSLQDYMVSVFGRREKDGFANRPWDNTGVQYGLKALLAGKLTASQFVDVNEKVGGRDIDYEPTPERAKADPVALTRAYRSGAANQGTNLDQVAIIDLRGPDPGAFHDVYRTYVVRARLQREHGTSANQVLWRGQAVLLGDATFSADSIIAMDSWLSAVEKDRRDIPLARKIIEDKPKTVTDRCANGSGSDVPAEECDAVVQSYTTPRIEAGEPFVDDILKCELKPLRTSDYFPVQFSADQWARLQKVFPEGVCDWSKPGVGREPTVPWQTYKDGPGGVPLGPAPASVPVGSAKRCVRGLKLRLRARRGDPLVSAQVFVDGRRAKRVKGKALRRPVRVRITRRVARVKLIMRTRSGRRVVITRTYRRCR